MAQATLPAQPVTPPLHPLATAFGAPEWSEGVGQRIVWMVQRAESRADLVLTPPDLGRIEVSLALKGEQATASFVSASPLVREALESALPRLREVLADAGIQLGQAQVSAHSGGQGTQPQEHGENSALVGPRTDLPGEARLRVDSTSGIARLKSGQGLVDVFA